MLARREGGRVREVCVGKRAGATGVCLQDVGWWMRKAWLRRSLLGDEAAISVFCPLRPNVILCQHQMDDAESALKQ